MDPIVLDANAVIMHGRAFPERVRTAVGRGETIVMPESAKRELVDDVLENTDAPRNHRDSAREIEGLVEEGAIECRTPDFDAYGAVVDEARRRIAGESLPEHSVKADQYIPAVVCELAEEGSVRLVTADVKLRRVVREITERRGVGHAVTLRDPKTVL